MGETSSHWLRQRWARPQSCRKKGGDKGGHGFSRAVRFSWWTQSSQFGQVLYHGRDGRATKPSWHGRLARDSLGGMRLLAIDWRFAAVAQKGDSDQDTAECATGLSRR